MKIRKFDSFQAHILDMMVFLNVLDGMEDMALFINYFLKLFKHFSVIEFLFLLRVSYTEHLKMEGVLLKEFFTIHQ